MAEKIRAIMIVEMAGRPPEFVTENLKTHAGHIRATKGIEIISESINEPKKIEIPVKDESEEEETGKGEGKGEKKGEEMYTCFAEIEFYADSFLKLTEMIFDFMPSSIEILEPSEVSYDITEATSFLNTLAGRLHRYDEVARMAQLQLQNFIMQLQQKQQAAAQKKESEKTKEVEKPAEKEKK